MSKNSRFPAQATQSKPTKSFSSTILIAEAAIATLVLSVFVSSSPKLISTHAPESRLNTAINSNGPKPQLFTVQLPTQGQGLFQVKTERVN